jgi:hypothetical protein
MIGWQQVLNGHWTNVWAQQLESLTTQKGEHKAIEHIKVIWLVILKLWKRKCDGVLYNDIHQRTQDTPIVEAIYQTNHKIESLNQQILDQPLSTSTLSLPIFRLKYCIARTENFF